MANLLTHSFEYDTLGSAPPTTGSPTGSDTPFDQVVTGTSATNVVDNTHVMHGSLAGEFATSTSSAQSYVAWSTSMGTASQIWFRAYFYLTAALTASTPVARFLQGTVTCATLQMTSAGKIQFQDANGTAITSTRTSNSLPTNAWFRVEGYVIGSATAGKASISLYLTPDSTTADETKTSAATQNTNGAMDHYRFGIPAAFANVTAFWIDDIGLSNSGAVGPAGGTPALPDVAAGTEAISAVIVTTVTLADVGAGVETLPTPAIGIPQADVAGAVDAPVIAAAVPLPGTLPPGPMLDQSGNPILDQSGNPVLEQGGSPAVEPGAAVDALVAVNVGTPIALADVGAGVDAESVIKNLVIFLADSAAGADSFYGAPYLIPGPAPAWVPPPPQPGNVLWGTGILLTAPLGTPLPADQQLGLSSAWRALGWAYVGATINGVQLTWSPGSTLIVQGEEQQIPVAIAVQTGNATITTSLAEETAVNVNLAFGNGSSLTVTPAGHAQPGKTVITLSGQRPVMAAALIAMNQLGYPRVMSVPRVQSVGSLQVAWRRAAGPRTWQLQLQAVCPLASITWNDITSVATS